MLSREDLESYLIRMDVEHEEIAEGMYLVRGGEEGLPLVLDHSPPLLVLRLKVMDLPSSDPELTHLYRSLLEWNANELVHGAYGIEKNEVVLLDTLQLEALDYGRLQASVESLLMAAAGHMERIRSLAPSTAEG